MTSNSLHTVPHDSKAAFRKLLQGASWAVLGKSLTYPFGLFVTLILAKLLTTEELGGYFLVMSTVIISSMLVRAGVDATMCKMIARSLANNNVGAAKKVLRIGVITFLFAATIAYIFYSSHAGVWLFSAVEAGHQLFNLLGIIGLMVVLFSCIGYSCEALRGFNDLRAAALLDQQALQRFLQLLGLIVVASAGASLQLRDALVISVAAMSVPAVLGVLFVTKRYNSIGNDESSIRTIDVLRHSPPFLLIRISTWVFDGAAIWMLSTTRPLEESAMYGAANALALLILAPAQVVNAAVGPTLVALHARNKIVDFRNAARAAAAIIAVPAILGSVILVVVGEFALELLFAAEYGQAYNLLVILVVGRAASTFLGIPLTLLSMTHHQDLVLRTLILTSGLTLTAYIFAAESYGAFGVACASAGAIFTQGLILALLAWRVLDINTLPRFSAAALRNMITLLRSRD